MKKYTILFTALILSGGAAMAQKNAKTTKKETGKKEKVVTKMTADGFTILPSGLEYKYIKDAPGNTFALGDQLEMNFKSSVGDSILFDSRQMMNGKTVLFAMQKPAYNGDVNEGLLMLTPGDVVVFRTSLDSIVKAGNQLLPWMKNSDKMVYNVEVVNIKTNDQVQKEFKEQQDAQVNTDDKLIQEYMKSNNIKAEKTASGLYYVVTKKGTGENAKPGQRVTVNYTGRTLSNEVFDSNVDSAFHHVQPFSFDLDRGNVIKGWDEGVALMNKGAKGTLLIPSRYAYGPQSPSPKIPANAVLVFDVEVTDITGAAAAPAPHNHNEHDGHKH
jgi:FKBP-type peptidyl-prolyl cis-trans isomerase FkpA